MNLSDAMERQYTDGHVHLGNRIRDTNQVITIYMIDIYLY